MTHRPDRKLPLLTTTFALLLAIAGAQDGFSINVSLSQLDSSALLATQTVSAYVSVTDDQGAPVTGLAPQAFTILESPDGTTFHPVRGVNRFTPNAGAAEGITFLLLIDNSGSMYDALDSKPTSDPQAMRITLAKAAVRDFLSSVTSPSDRVGLAVFNTNFQVLSPATSNRERLASLLEGIRRPAPEDAYTELYASLSLASREFAGIRGRKAIIVLSDGENYPYFQYSGKEHPVFKRRIFPYTEPILANQQEGVTVYGINYGSGSVLDSHLGQISVETGGRVFDAANGEQLAGIYQEIHRQVAGEYRLDYRASIAPSERTYVRVDVSTNAGNATATRFYFASTVFGLPLDRLSPLLLLPFLLAGLALWGLTKLRLERRPRPASLEVLQTRVGHPVTRVVPLTTSKTIIGSSPAANLTIVGAPQVKEQHTSILYDPKDKSYTIVGGGDVTVNNQPARSRKLESGDVIDVGGATVVFDDDKEKGKGGK